MRNCARAYTVMGLSTFAEAQARADLIGRIGHRFELAVGARLDLDLLAQADDVHASIRRLISPDRGWTLRPAEEWRARAFAFGGVIEHRRFFAGQAHDLRQRSAGALREQIVGRVIGLLKAQAASIRMAQCKIDDR